MRRTGVMLGCAVMLCMLAIPATAQEYPPDPKPISISRSVVHPGDTITISGEQAAANAKVTIQFFPGPVELATVEAGDDGRWSTEIRIPLDARPGRHVLSAGSNGEVLATINIEVRPAGVALNADPASSSGTGLGVWLLAAAVVALAVGGALLVLRRRRDRARQMPA
jgi:hypothetical protein